MKRFLNINALPVIWRGDEKINFKFFAKNEKHEDRIPDFSTLIMVFDGTLSFLENGKQVDVTAGEYYIQEQGMHQSGVAIIDPPVYFYLHFTGDFYCEEDSGLPVKGKIDISEIKNTCNSAMAVARKGNYEFEANLLLYKLIKRLYEYNSPKRRGYDIAANIAEFIEKNAANINGLDDVCRKLNYNKDYIIRVFKKRFNITPYQYIKYQKTMYAKELLSGSNLTVSQIAAICNYPDESVFYRSFKSVAGISPNEWRKTL